jgi:hypothetical protein
MALGTITIPDIAGNPITVLVNDAVTGKGEVTQVAYGPEGSDPTLVDDTHGLPVKTVQDIALSELADTVGAAPCCDVLIYGNLADGTQVALPVLHAVVDVNTSGDHAIVAADPSARILVVKARLISGGAVNVKWLDGTAGTEIDGLCPLSTSTGYVDKCDQGIFAPTSINKALVLNLSANIQVGGSIAYVKLP